MRIARLSQITIQQLTEHFIAGTPACASAPLCTITRNIARTWYNQFRVIIYDNLQSLVSPFEGFVKADESYFDERRKEM